MIARQNKQIEFENQVDFFFSETMLHVNTKLKCVSSKTIKNEITIICLANYLFFLCVLVLGGRCCMSLNNGCKTPKKHVPVFPTVLRIITDLRSVRRLHPPLRCTMHPGTGGLILHITQNCCRVSMVTRPLSRFACLQFFI